MSAIRRLLERAQPGSAGGIAQHIRRGERLASLIHARWQIQRPEQWRVKHLHWVLERGLTELSPASRYHYYRTARVLAATLGHWPDWEVALRGAWTHPAGLRKPKTRDAAARGGRPPKLAHRAKLRR
ncbi:MAG: hypothetical protein VBE63_00550 [Lamprobacter sp.]|uniref:hypothetical protein n=1 Tax=Lamprobacter sp. TaxID=3100796 RepID=UPI002B25CE0C|nr:hypothetical protein [Lamprobacter sp.]MEA3638414.1 hypothetical protein [Lamprobacter sp.]